MIRKEIVVCTCDGVTRVALLEDGVPVEIYIEPVTEFCMVGSIFKGKVDNVLPGIEAAFVDVGMGRNAFLYVNDVLPPPGVNGRRAGIRELLRPGQEIVVQVAKDPLGSKGPRVTMRVNLPGRYTVLMPTVNHVGVSRRIEDEAERECFKRVVNEARPPGMGVIVRTAAQGAPEEALKEDVANLVRLWREIQARAQKAAAPSLLYQECALLPRVIRDLFTEEVERLVVSNRADHARVMNEVVQFDKKLISRVFLDERDDLMDRYGVTQEIEKALQRRIWLKCGGYLIFDQAEALTVIDVNTGKYTGRTDLEDTVYKTNLDAAVEIARQLRLRNLGGIIIIDFIDMSHESHRAKVLEVFAEEIKKDRRRTHILGLTRLGLVELTRKKVHPSLAETLLTVCPTCHGLGKVAADPAVRMQHA
ncbi:MAG: Rne/Rng family ribonuclease [Thermoanaerobacterales bacterium]|nr:Rne/Rng family ribonuclease [Bacillota bacterium]MDI6906476.1 Rne/Rng family ribonuclease [Thermoanaerobacterales bacterium]